MLMSFIPYKVITINDVTRCIRMLTLHQFPLLNIDFPLLSLSYPTFNLLSMRLCMHMDT